LKVIVDTNVVLDVLLARRPFVRDSASVFALIEQSDISAFLCSTTIMTVDYILNQSLTRTAAKKALHSLLELFEIATVNRSVIEEALQSKMADFEDAVLAHSGNLAGAEAIITRNTKDFKRAPVKALDPAELLAILDK
jgi:predicted nucleic acid-binding protein